MMLDDRDVTKSALDALQPLVTQSMPWLGPEMVAAQELLSETGATSIAVGSDQHRIGRVFAHCASESGAHVTVLQHGVPQEAVGFVPVVASTVAVWSSGFRDWFVAQGTPPHALAILGNPRFDELVRLRQGRMARQTEQSPPRLLLALTQTASATNRGVVSTALGALRLFPRSQLVIKVHPGQSDWRFLRQAVEDSELSDRVRVARHEPLYPLLQWADVTLVHRSTVALESLVIGTPIAVIAADGEPTTAEEELRGLKLDICSTVSELASAVSSIAANPADFFASRREALTQVAGPLDGRSTERIAAFLTSRVLSKAHQPSLSGSSSPARSERGVDARNGVTFE